MTYEQYKESYDAIMKQQQRINNLVYNQALEDFERKIKECCSIVGSCDFEDMSRIKEQLIK